MKDKQKYTTIRVYRVDVRETKKEIADTDMDMAEHYHMLREKLNGKNKD